MKLAGFISPSLRELLTLALLCTLVSGFCSYVQAAPPPVKELAEENCTEIAQDVFNRVSDSPKKAEDIIAIAVKDHPKCASAIVSKGIAAMAPKKPGNDYKDVVDPKDADSNRTDPKIVESILSTVLNYIKGDPELMDTIIQTVLESYPEIKSDIPGILGNIYIDPLKKGDDSIVRPGQILPTPTPTPIPPTTPIPVTPDGIR